MASLTEPAAETTGALFRALRSAGVEADLAYRADDEVRVQAGQNVIAVLGARIDALQGQIDSLRAEIAAQGAKADSTRWMMGAVPALLAALTALGVFNTALGLAS